MTVASVYFQTRPRVQERDVVLLVPIGDLPGVVVMPPEMLRSRG